MKNIFLLPTDEPSRLWFDNLSHKLVLSEMKTLVGYKAARNVYITNDEEIKEGDFYFDGIDLVHRKSKYNYSLVDGNKNAKKIILTTDHDLIKEGVQSIDYDFLKWFVNNPTCEFIHAYNDRVVGYEYDNYTIIIPKERKPWRFCETPEEKCTMNYCDENGCQNRKRNLTDPIEPKLEYVAANLADPNICKTENWIAGAKWHAEKMYSKQDINHLEWMYNRMIEIHNENPNYDYMIKFKEIINQFKNK